jgi:hypothetical protein
MAQTVFDLGDPITSRLSLGVTPDGTTAVAIAVYKPDGTLVSPTPTITGPAAQDYTAPFVASQSGDYVAVWTVTGTGAGISAKVYNVRPLPSPSNTRPIWTPFLSEVGDYAPNKTRDTSVGSDIIFGTFNGLTKPDDGQAQRMLDKVCTGIISAFGIIAPSMYAQAAALACLRTAADIELAWPERPGDLTIYNALKIRIDFEWEQLEDLSSNVPIYDFPDPPPWADVSPFII